jgi:Type I phosphodiesterase / nucleotide pyrophosphatase
VTRKLVLAVIDGLTPSMLEASLGTPSAPWLTRLAEHGSYGRAVSVFPSLTPVCLSSIATGAGPDVHEIPHLVWYHRRERRLVEYGSSFGAMRVAGTRRSIRDAIVNMNAEHLGSRAVTVYEALEDAGLVPAAVNITCYRGRTAHAARVPMIRGPVFAPRRFFFYNLFESDPTGAPRAWRNRPAGTVDEYATAVGRWLVTRDGFDFLLFYLSDYDYASHAYGPDAAHAALERSDAALGSLVEAAGGLDAFLERYALVVCSDHGQTRVEGVASLQQAFAGLDGVLVTASNRAGQVYRLGAQEDERSLARRLDSLPAVEVALFREDGAAVARRDGEELRFVPVDNGWELEGDPALLDHPNGLERAWQALANPNAGELLVSAAAGWEFADLGGRHHLGGGSHGSLVPGDSEVPVLAVGIEAAPAAITDLAPLVLGHFGIAPPTYMRPLSRAA